jgi:hypothetical protein
MTDKNPESPGGWDAKINAEAGTKDAAGKAMGYEDAEAQRREQTLLNEKSKKAASGSDE